jgi:hypothetical protein
MNPSRDPLATSLHMPRLSDDNVVQIHDFLHHLLDLFEARYGDQIHRFYQDLYSDFGADPDSIENPDDPPF